MVTCRAATHLLSPLGLALALGACGGPPADAPMSGYAEAELVYLAPTAAGVLQTVDVRRGDRVRRGQAVFALDAEAEALSSDAADARRARAEANAANLRTGRRPQELAALDQQLAQAQAALTASVAALQRQQRLVEQGFVAALRLDELVAARDRDAARQRELQALRALASEAARSDEIAAAAAEARAGTADLALARWRVGQRQRTAPVDAVVFDVMARPGEWLAAGTPVLALLPAAALKVRFFVPEPALPRATIGAEVQVACDGCPAGLTARIRWVSPQAEFTPPVIYSVGTRSKLVFMVEAEPREATPLKPGQPVDVRWAAPPG
jgi:HlyD family secretion protein